MIKKHKLNTDNRPEQCSTSMWSKKLGRTKQYISKSGNTISPYALYEEELDILAKKPDMKSKVEFVREVYNARQVGTPASETWFCGICDRTCPFLCSQKKKEVRNHFENSPCLCHKDVNKGSFFVYFPLVHSEDQPL